MCNCRAWWKTQNWSVPINIRKLVVHVPIIVSLGRRIGHIYCWLQLYTEKYFDVFKIRTRKTIVDECVLCYRLGSCRNVFSVFNLSFSLYGYVGVPRASVLLEHIIIIIYAICHEERRQTAYYLHRIVCCHVHTLKRTVYIHVNYVYYKYASTERRCGLMGIYYYTHGRVRITAVYISRRERRPELLRQVKSE